MADEPKDDEPLGSEENSDGGTPLPVFHALEEEPSPNFLLNLRRKIYRRSLSSQLASAAWDLPGRVLLEIWNLVLGLVVPIDRNRGDRP